MDLYMKQKVFSWKDRFTIVDEQANPVYAVEGEFFSWGKKLHVYDANGAEVAFIRQKVWSFLAQFTVEIGGQERAKVVRELTFLKPRYRIEGPGWMLHGNFWEHEFLIEDERGAKVMELSKHWFTWGDSYQLHIENPEDQLLCVCVTLALDAAMADAAAASSAST